MKSKLNFIDVGCANKLCNIVTLFDNDINIIGFEPEEEGKNRLINETEISDNITILPYGLYDSNCKKILYINKNRELSSLLIPNLGNIANVVPYHKIDKWHVIDQITIDVKKFADVGEDLIGDDYINYLKLDTQGTEYEIMMGFGRFLKNTSIIKIEIEFIELYKKQKLFNAVHNFLENNNFILGYFERIVTFYNREKYQECIKDDLFTSSSKVIGEKVYISSTDRDVDILNKYLRDRTECIKNLVDHRTFHKTNAIEEVTRIKNYDSLINELQNKLITKRISKGSYILIKRNICTIFCDGIYVNKNKFMDSDTLSENYIKLNKKLYDSLHIPHEYFNF
jgi:hypothetical protein